MFARYRPVHRSAERDLATNAPAADMHPRPDSSHTLQMRGWSLQDDATDGALKGPFQLLTLPPIWRHASWQGERFRQRPTHNKDETAKSFRTPKYHASSRGGCWAP